MRCSARQEAFGTTHEHTSQKQCRAGAPIRASGPLALDRGRAETRESWCSMRPPALVGRPSHRLTTSHARDIRAFISFQPQSCALPGSECICQGFAVALFSGPAAPPQVVREARQEFSKASDRSPPFSEQGIGCFDRTNPCPCAGCCTPSGLVRAERVGPGMGF